MDALGDKQRALLQEMAESDDVNTRSKAAFHRGTPVSVLDKLSEDTDETVRIGVSLNPSTSPDALSILSHDTNRTVVEAVAEHPSATPEIVLGVLEEEIRYTYDTDLSYPAEALLSKMRSALDPSTPSSTLKRLAREREPYLPHLKIAVARNHATPATTLKRLARAKKLLWWSVVDGIQDPEPPPEGLLFVPHTIAGRELDILYNLARNPSTPPSLLAKLVEQVRWKNDIVLDASTPPPVYIFTQRAIGVCWRIAMHSSCPPHILEELGRDSHSLVRLYVAMNPNTPPHLQAELREDDEEDVRWMAGTYLS